MLELEALRDELVKLAEQVGKHKEVAEIANISVAYLSQIRSGANVTLNIEKNRELVKSLIGIYRQLGKEKIEALTEVLK